MNKALLTSIFTILFSGLFFACKDDTKKNDTPKADIPDTMGYKIEKVLPHDTSLFTEGLLIYKGSLYESTGDPGRQGKSKIVKVDLNTGKIQKQLVVDKVFGEGIVILRDTIYQLTWTEKIVFVYNMDFKKIKEYTIGTDNGQGWGMTTDGTYLILDDGTSSLYYYDPSSFTLVKKLTVTDSGDPSYNLNELEYIDGFIYANQWQLSYILKIDPATGKVVAKADLKDIWDVIQRKNPKAEFLNGIAYDEATKKIYVTGKRSPELYEIKFN